MSNAIHCPKCGSDDVECVEDPHHNHLCFACGYTLLGGEFNPTVDLAELDRLMRAARKFVWTSTTTTHTNGALMAGLASQAEALRRALDDVARWVVETFDFPGGSTFPPPPKQLRESIYRYLHGQYGDELSYDEVVAWVHEEAGWPVTEDVS